MKESLITPCFIVDEKELKENIESLHDALKQTWDNYIIGYSYKTNSLLWIINYLKQQGVYAEVVSDLEFKLAKEINYDYKKIIFNGPNKGKKIFIDSIKKGSIVNIDSHRELEWLKEERFDEEVSVGIRVNFNLEKECPGETAMGLDGGRFGFSLENGDLQRVVKEIDELENVKISGIHLHHTTKTRSLNIYKVLARKACEISKLFDYELEYVDIGGGFFGGLENKPSYYNYMKVISDELRKCFNSKYTKLIVEPGAALIASPVSFMCEVVDVKDTYNNRIVTVNVSRNNIDPLMNKNNYFLEINYNSKKNKIKEQIICGYTCMENDRIIKLSDKEELSIGDRVLFNKVGSYTMCLSPLFIEYFPTVYLKNIDNEFKCIREKWDVKEYIQKSII